MVVYVQSLFVGMTQSSQIQNKYLKKQMAEVWNYL